MNASLKTLRLLACLGLLAATLGLLRAEDSSSTDTPPPATPAEGTSQASEKATPSVEADDKDGELRSLTPTESITSTEPAQEKVEADKADPQQVHIKADIDAEVPFGHITIGEGHKAKEAVSVFGSTTVKGIVEQDAVSIFGHTRISEGAKVGHDAVAVFGHLFVDGEVNHDTIAIFGNIHYGPKAVSKGQTVVVFGQISKAEGAQTGPTQAVMSFPGLPDFSNMGAWAKDCLLKGRLLSFSSGTGWAWAIAGAHLLFYLVLSLILRGPMTRCTETLEKRAGMSLLTTFLVFILTPLVIIILAIGTITAVLIPIYIVGLFLLGIFGRAVMLAFFGRLITRFLPGHERLHIALSVLIGGVIVALLYCVPLAAFLIHSLIGSIGLGAVVLAITERMKREPKGPKPVPASVPPAPSTTSTPAAPLSLRPAPLATGPMASTSAFTAPTTETSANAEPPVLTPTELPTPAAPATEPAASSTPILPGAPSFSAASAPQAQPQNPGPAVKAAAAPADSALPRAGFWLRMGALSIDFVLVLLLCGFASGILPFLHMGPWFFIALAAYGAFLWKHRGTTVGGTICRIAVVRMDDAPMDWNTAAVRALGCILSGFAAGLGFIWIAIDRDQEAWHDKISGTVVVRVPKTRPLV